jgi:hypothetical protein
MRPKTKTGYSPRYRVSLFTAGRQNLNLLPDLTDRIEARAR